MGDCYHEFSDDSSYNFFQASLRWVDSQAARHQPEGYLDENLPCGIVGTAGARGNLAGACVPRHGVYDNSDSLRWPVDDQIGKVHAGLHGN
jgi:hypothetical protein